MKFIECYIENFGKLQNFNYHFNEGLNVLHANNGYGKTTFTAFIKCMLYGMEDTKRQDLAENDRKHYMPWQGGRCGGTLTIEEGGRRYRIERSFAPKGAEDSFALYDLGTGRASEDYTSAIGEEILGIDRDGFERTLFLSERRLAGKNDNKSISAKLSELVGCDGDIGGVDAAMKRLEEKRKYYKKTGGRGLIDELSTKISVCSTEIAALERARESTREIELLLAEQKRELSELEQKKTKLEAERDALRIKRSKLTIAEQYSALSERLQRDTARLEDLRCAFGGSIPTLEEIDDAAYKMREAETLENSAKQTPGGEYEVLTARFKGKTDLSEIERTAALVGEIAVDEEKLRELSEKEEENSSLFCGRIPEKNELLGAKKDVRSVLPLLILTAVLTVAVSAILFFVKPILAMIPIAIGLLVAVFLSLSSTRRYARALRLLTEISDATLPRRAELCRYIDMLLAALDDEAKKAAGQKEKERACEKIRGEIHEKRNTIISLLTRLGAPADDPSTEMINQKMDYLRYCEKEFGERAAAEERRAALASAASKREEVSAFLGRFSALGNSPFERLKEMLGEYNYLIASTAERKEECARLKEKYGEDTESTGFNQERLTALEIELHDCESTIEVRRKEYAAIELRLSSEAESYERVQELKARAEALTEQKTDAEDTLDTILKTKSALLSAMGTMTSKYLGKTRDGFEKYRRLIEGDCRRDFLLDTSFSLSVGDVGGTHSEESYSRGTRDIYAMATRLALSDALYDGELPPIILDDPFTALDDRWLEAALGLVRSIAEKRQVVYITCHESRNPN